MDTEEFAKQYPTLAAANRIKPDSQKIGQFLEWLENTKGVDLVKYDLEPKNGRYRVEAYYDIQGLLYEYFEIDRKAYDAEQLKLLESIRGEKIAS